MAKNANNTTLLSLKNGTGKVPKMKPLGTVLDEP